MRTEIISRQHELLVRRLVLEPGEATPWHTDPFRRFSVVVRGERLRIEFRDGEEPIIVAAHPGLAGWDAPDHRIHRAINDGGAAYEEVVLFFVSSEKADPQPDAR